MNLRSLWTTGMKDLTRPFPLIVIGIGVLSVFFIALSNVMFLFLFLMLYRAGCKDKDIFSPFFLFMPVPLSVMLYWSKISSYYLPELPLGTRIWIFIGSAAFYLGLMFRRHKFYPYLRQVKPVIGYSLFLTLALGILPYVISTMVMGTLPILARTNIDELKSQFQLPIIGMFFLFLSFAILIAREQGKFFKSVCVLAILLSLIKAAKFDVIFMAFVIMFAIVGHQMHLSRTLKKRIIVAILAFLIFVPLLFEQNYNMRFGETMDMRYDYLISSDRMHTAIPIAAFKVVQPYFYFVSSWANFDYCLQHVETYKYGMMTMRPFISLFRLDYLIDVDYTKMVLNPAFNTHSFLTDYYYDFGYAGLVLLPFLMGIVISWIYRRSRSSNDTVLHTEYAVCGFAVVMMFFSNHFSAGYPVIAFVLFESYRLFKDVAAGRGYV